LNIGNLRSYTTCEVVKRYPLFRSAVIWVQLEYNNKNDWYYFDENGYMKTDWVLWNGRQYYLNPVSDGTQGRMVTGWLFIDSNWCYFNEVSDGVLGAFVQDADNIPGSI